MSASRIMNVHSGDDDADDTLTGSGDVGMSDSANDGDTTPSLVSDTSNASSVSSSQASAGPPPNKRRKKMDAAEIKAKISKPGQTEYKLVSQGATKPGASVAWDMCDKIYTVKDNNFAGFVKCRKCPGVFSYNERSATTHITRHPCTAKPKGPRQQPITGFAQAKLKLPSKYKTQITDAAVDFTAMDLRPFSTIEGPGFSKIAQRFVNIGAELGPIDIVKEKLIPHRTTVSRNLATKVVLLKEEVGTILKDTMFRHGGSITMDLWTDSHRQIPYLSVTAHYIDDDWKLVDRVLATQEVDATFGKNAETIYNTLLIALKPFGVLRHMLKSLIFVTDRGSNILASLRNQDKLPCSAHMLHNILTDLFKAPTTPAGYWECILACKALVKYFKKGELMKKLPTTLKQDSETRWNSKLEMFASVHAHIQKIDQILVSGKHDQINRSANIDTDTLSELVEFLQPFKDLSDVLEGSKEPTLHVVVPGRQPLIDHCSTIGSEDSENIITLKKIALEIIEKKFKIDRYHITAICLNPRMRKMKCLDVANKEWAETAMRELLAEQKQIQGRQRDQPGTTSQEQAPTTSTVPKHPHNAYDDSDDDTETSSAEKDEWQEYLKLKVNKNWSILETWRNIKDEFPLLYAIARKFLSIPATSAPSERAFSLAGHTLEKRRTSLDPQTVNDTLFLNSYERVKRS